MNNSTMNSIKNLMNTVEGDLNHYHEEVSLALELIQEGNTTEAVTVLQNLARTIKPPHLNK